MRNPRVPRRSMTLALLGVLSPALLAQSWSESQVIGETRRGAPLRVTALGMPGEDALGRTRHERPALLLIAGAQAHHLVGTATVERLTDRLLDEHRDLLRDHTVYLLADLTPDPGPLQASPRYESPRTRVRGDADHDRRVDEDGADDLNHDGLITMMRVPNPPPGSGLVAEWIIDEGEPRLMRKPAPEEGEIATHALLIEGVDNDGDGKFNEDGPGGAAGGGVNLDRNFPSHYDEHADDAGLYATSEPETRALIDWLLTRDNIVAALVYGPHDNLVKAPPTGKYDPSGRMPVGIEAGDEKMHKAIGTLFTETTGMKQSPKGKSEGSLVSYLYSDFGVWAFSTPVWSRPEPERLGDDGGDDAADSEAPEEEAPDEATLLRERGTPEELIRFLTGSDEERGAMLAEFESLSPDEQAARMQAIGNLPADIRARVMSIAQGQGDPGMGGADGSDGDSEGDEKSDAQSKADNEELAWLEYIDEQRGGEGFVDWVKVDHPQLGEVEVGGFVPGFRVNAPEDAIDELVDEQAKFVGELLARLPSLDVSDPVAEPLGAGLWRVRVRASNPGFLPTRSAMGVKARRLAPVVVAIDVEPDAIVSGARHRQLWTIPGSGGHVDCEWIVRADPGQVITVTTRSSVYADRTGRVELKEGR
ncbi:MAG: M14 family zinc carboxypeptidase [Phycisphaerales bacterium JB059]